MRKKREELSFAAMVENPSKKIAVLDAEPYVCDFLDKILTAAGHAVLTANDGQQGLKLINREKPDLIILDLIMPGLSGYALLDILNAKGSKIPILVVSSMSNIGDNLAHQGIAGLLIKPIDEERLLIHVDCIFKLEEAAREQMKPAKGVAVAAPDEVSPAQTKAPGPLHSSADKPAPTEQPPAEQPPPPESLEPEDAAPKEGAPLVLVVEDEPDMRMILSKLLEHQGFRVKTACDGPEGLKMAEGLLPDAMILDLMLPKMDGFQVCRLLKFNDKYRHIPIVILTARSLPADRELAEASGADAYLVKPFEVESLMKTIRGVMAHK